MHSRHPDRLHGSVVGEPETHRGEPSDLVPQPFGLDVSNIFTDALVCVKVESELLVVLLHQHTGCPLDGLGPDTPLHRAISVYCRCGSFSAPLGGIHARKACSALVL